MFVPGTVTYITTSFNLLSDPAAYIPAGNVTQEKDGMHPRVGSGSQESHYRNTFR